MNKFSSSNAFNSFTPINDTNRFSRIASNPIRSYSISDLINQFEKQKSTENELQNVQPEAEDSKIKQEAIAELNKEDEEVTVITSDIEERVFEPVVELTEIYPKKNEINIEASIQKEIMLSHQGYKEAKMRLIVDEVILNLRKKKLQNGWSS